MNLYGHIEVFDIDPVAAPHRSTPFSGGELEALLADGSARRETTNHNRVLNFGLSAMSRLIGGVRGGSVQIGNARTSPGSTVDVDTVSDLLIDVMGFGNSASPGDNTDGTKLALTNGASIYNATVGDTNLAVTYPDFFSVQFEGLITAAAIPSTLITELGLFMSALAGDQDEGVMFSRVVLETPINYTGTLKQVNHKIGPLSIA